MLTVQVVFLYFFIVRSPVVILRNKLLPSKIVHFHAAEAGGKRTRGSRERAPVYVQCEPKNNDGVALQQLPINFAMSFEDRLAKP